MNKTERKQYCLQIMGITSWQLRQEAPHLSHRYLLLVSEELNREKHELINRMLQALSWPFEETRIEKLEDSHLTSTIFYQKIKEIQPEKVLLYGQIMSQKIVQTTLNPCSISIDNKQLLIGILPTLQELLNDISAKRRAWQVMQELKKMG